MPEHEVSDAVENQTNKIVVRSMCLVVGLLGTGLFGIVGWIGRETMENRQFRLSGDRYTQTDAAHDQAAIFARVAAIERDVTRLQVTLERIERGM